jgi:hypothetical protein
MQDSTMAHHMANNSVNVLAEVFGEWEKCQALLSACSRDLHPLEFYLWDMLRVKWM